MRRFATLASLALAATMVVALAAPVSAQQMGRRGGPVITCPTVGVHIRSVSQHSLHVTGYLRVGNNSRVYGHNFYARVHFWTSWADRFFEVRGYLDPFSYNRYHFSKYIAAQTPDSTVHWNRTCYPTD
jgi:hypothetical protein